MSREIYQMSIYSAIRQLSIAQLTTLFASNPPLLAAVVRAHMKARVS